MQSNTLQAAIVLAHQRENEMKEEDALLEMDGEPDSMIYSSDTDMEEDDRDRCMKDELVGKINIFIEIAYE